MAFIRCVEHPLALDKLGRLRDRATDVPTFRRLVHEISLFLAMECTRDVVVEERLTETPIRSARVSQVVDSIVLIPILRAGLGMVEGMLQVVPNASVGHIGLHRDPTTLSPVEYYANTPRDLASQQVIVLDPMLATGGSADAALALLKGQGAKRIKLASLLAAPEGVERINRAHPDVQVYTVAVDEGLNDHAYIVPGLGDAGDRMFGTL